MDLRVKSKK